MLMELTVSMYLFRMYCHLRQWNVARLAIAFLDATFVPNAEHHASIFLIRQGSSF